MADEKKPKIDLKARLGKAGGGGAGGLTPPPAGVVPGSNPVVGGIPAPPPTPQPTKGGLPVPPGIPVGPPPNFKSPALALDPSNPLAAAVAPPQQPRKAEPPKPQRIEVDELTVVEARKGARKQGLLAGVVMALVLGAVGYMTGVARETSKGRNQSVAHAKALAGEVDQAKAQLKALQDKLEEGRTALAQKKFPDNLPKDLGGINVDFEGSKLAGVRFSGFSQETTTGLIDFITGVQGVNERKSALANLLTRLQKPLQDQFAAAAANKPPPISFVVLINRDGAKNPYGILAPLQKPVELSAQMPADYTVTDPMSRSVVKADKLTAIDKPGAAYVIPKSIEAACPSETAGQSAQLASQLSKLLTDIKGEAPAAGEAITEPKPGLLERADKLVANLNKVQ